MEILKVLIVVCQIHLQRIVVHKIFRILCIATRFEKHPGSFYAGRAVSCVPGCSDATHDVTSVKGPSVHSSLVDKAVSLIEFRLASDKMELFILSLSSTEVWGPAVNVCVCVCACV